jgi:chloramphenicol-sensitive protein RarD
MGKANHPGVTGTWYAILAFGLWGLLPVYWKLLSALPAYEIVAHRVIWACLFTALLLQIQHKWPILKSIFRDRKKLRAIILCAGLLGINWLTYIYAVNTGHVLDASLGYYINPLISVFLGMVVLKERLGGWQKAAIGLAFVAVTLLTVQYGRLPWIALTLAFTFGIYGLIKKTSAVDAIIGLIMETLFLVPAGMAYIFFTTFTGKSLMLSSTMSMVLLLVSTGVVTAVPLLLFGAAVQRIPLSRVGFIQYLTPSCFFLLGILVYRETFSTLHLVSFILIWLALIVYSLSACLPVKKRAGS